MRSEQYLDPNFIKHHLDLDFCLDLNGYKYYNLAFSHQIGATPFQNKTYWFNWQSNEQVVLMTVSFVTIVIIFTFSTCKFS